ncbi:MAG: cation:proton antiporter [Lachnotalea sp.]
MENAINFQSILIISVLAFFTPLAINSFKKVKIPYVVGEILVGLIFGKSFLNLIYSDIWIVFLSNLGVAYLMFLSGLEIDFSQFQFKKGQKSDKLHKLLICLIMLIISIGVSLVVSVFLVKIGLINNLVFSAILLSATAPGIVVPFLKQRDLIHTDYGQFLLIFTLMCEFICLIAITVVSSILDKGLSYRSFFFLLVIMVSYLIYRILKQYIRKFRFSIENYKNLHIEVRAAFALIIVLVSLSQSVGAEIVMGSFLAGVIFSLISGYGRENLKEKLDIIGYGFLIPIFFIHLGADMDIKSIFGDVKLLALIPLVLVAFYIVKLFTTLPLYFLFGRNKTVSAGVLLSSQLSIMIVGVQIAHNLGIINTSFYTLFILTAIISCFVFPMIFDRIFNFEGIKRFKDSALYKICIRESVLTNEDLFGKALKDIEFPKSCRIVMIIRGEDEILPNGESTLQQGDNLLLAGIKEKEEQMVRLVTK